MKTTVITIVLLLGYLLWRIGKQIMRTYQHVDEDTLRDFWKGKLKRNEEDQRRVITHLGYCEECRELFDKIRTGKPLEDHLVEK